MDARSDHAYPLSTAGRRAYLSTERRGSAGTVVLRLAIVFVILAGGAWVLAIGTGYAYKPITSIDHPSIPTAIPEDPPALQKLVKDQRTKQKQLQGALAAKTPRTNYIVIDQTQNRLYLRRGEETLRTAVCSAGSGYVLIQAGEKGRRWVFDTPRGVHKVRQRVERPVWKKPDWAFIEEGRPVPKSDNDRFEYGVLGMYALYFGNGFMIHGTLYERMLGRSVSHGCIRLGRDDLQYVWENAPIGTPIYIY